MLWWSHQNSFSRTTLYLIKICISKILTPSYSCFSRQDASKYTNVDLSTSISIFDLRSCQGGPDRDHEMTKGRRWSPLSNFWNHYFRYHGLLKPVPLLPTVAFNCEAATRNSVTPLPQLSFATHEKCLKSQSISVFRYFHNFAKILVKCPGLVFLIPSAPWTRKGRYRV